MVFSDHRFRHDQADRQETTSSLFLSLTPGHRGLFPNSTTPINILPKLLNAYVGCRPSLASEETWWVDMSTLRARGILALEAVDRAE